MKKPVDSSHDHEEMPDPMNALAYCGLCCQACSFKVAYEEQDRNHLRAMPAEFDCHKEEPLKPCIGCRNDPDSSCEIAKCARERSLLHCGDCPVFPCKRITEFTSDGIPHHAEAMANLGRIKQVGELDWLVEQEAHYRCPCGSRYSWYLQTCLHCSEK